MAHSAAPQTARHIPFPMPSAGERRRVAATILMATIIGAAAGLAIGRATAPVALPQARTGVAVTDGWAHSPITRMGGAVAAPVAGAAVADGWQFSPFTRLGAAYDPTGGVAVTDGWMHSPFTRGGSTLERLAALRANALAYQEQGAAAEARAR